MSLQPDQRLDHPSRSTTSSLILKGELPASDHQSNNLLVCHEWDNTVRWQPGERLHHLFEQRCDELARRGENEHLAVDASDNTWSYQALDRYANQLARHLSALGMAAGDIIGVLCDKSANSYVAMLAILKLNAAYVPLDPVFPQERISYIANDAGIKAILTLSQFLPLLRGIPISIVCLDENAEHIRSLPDSRPATDEFGQPVSELCYIIYTSGSTGNPKGVPIDQPSICNFVRVAAEVYGYTDSDRVYQGLTIAFDFAVEEIWVPLIVGATLLPNDTGNSLLGTDLSEFLLQRRATAMCCVPTLLQTIEEELDELRLLIVSGEACPQDLIARWHTPERTILNAYGPTETTVTATLSKSRPDQAVTIGKPLPTYSVVILEPGGETVLPFGEEGEIAIAGIGVARGYLNQEEKTKKAFIEDFLGIDNNPSGLIYRTGDLGLINEQGEIEYRGRIDLQVKIRGYRIELTEIESAILQIPQVAQAVVDTFEPSEGMKELVAYYTLNSGNTKLDEAELIMQLRESLPAYMVPSYYERLDIMPLMASDKADRKALPPPSGCRMNAGKRDFVKPGNSLEKIIADTLGELLQLEAISIRDNFFDDLGANSLLMARFSAKLRKKKSDINISMRDFYNHPSVEQLAGHLQNKSASTSGHIPDEPFFIPSRLQYYSCAALQLTSYFTFFYIGIWVLLSVVPWIIAANGLAELYLRTCAVLAASFIGWTSVSIAVKWIFVGKWKAETIPIWSFKYYRFWLYKQFILVNPMTLLKGYPIYNVYLRLLGAKIGENVVINCQSAPICTDLLQIGDNTILSHDSVLISYKARSNYIHTGPVTLGSNVVIGEGSVVDINTVMGDDTQLGHASCLHEGQSIPAGEHYHGNPSRQTNSEFAGPPSMPVSQLRQSLYSGFLILYWLAGITPLIICLLVYLVMNFAMPDFAPLTPAWALQILGITFAAFCGFFLLALLFNTVITRLLNTFITVEKTYVNFGIHYFIFKLLQSYGNSSSFNLLLGDSSYIVHYARLLGYKLSTVLQTGSNFGLEHKHDSPYLCHFGTGTMISDGFSMLNKQQSPTSFRLSHTHVGNRCFIGNNVYYPSDSKVGDNCLIATKAMVPTDGEIRENVGLLGSPCFEIPRSAAQHNELDPLQNAELRSKGIKRKNLHNLSTIARFTVSYFVYFYVGLMMIYAAAQSYASLGSTAWVVMANLFFLYSVLHFAIMERAAYGFERMQPVIASIYESDYWRVERVWKHSETFLRWLWLGTPFRAMINRLLGIRQGKMVFDDGLYVSEKTLLKVGDYCNFNRNSVMQSHSLEDGIYKSDYIELGDRCSIEALAFVHYGAVLGDDVILNADSFVIKGEHIGNGAVWGGNPATEFSSRTALSYSEPCKNNTGSEVKSKKLSMRA